MAYDVANAGEHYFQANKAIYRAVKQILEDNPPGSDRP
jgi:hypothetical protein